MAPQARNAFTRLSWNCFFPIFARKMQHMHAKVCTPTSNFPPCHPTPSKMAAGILAQYPAIKSWAYSSAKIFFSKCSSKKAAAAIRTSIIRLVE